MNSIASRLPRPPAVAGAGRRSGPVAAASARHGPSPSSGAWAPGTAAGPASWGGNDPTAINIHGGHVVSYEYGGSTSPVPLQPGHGHAGQLRREQHGGDDDAHRAEHRARDDQDRTGQRDGGDDAKVGGGCYPLLGVARRRKLGVFSRPALLRAIAAPGQKSRDADILVQSFPVQPCPGDLDGPPLLRARIQQSREPRERNAQSPAIRQLRPTWRFRRRTRT